MLTTQEVLENKRLNDGNMVAPWDPAVGQKPDGNLLDKRWPRESITGCEGPCRCLLPKGLERLLLTVRCISTDGEAQNAIRNMPACLHGLCPGPEASPPP